MEASEAAASGPAALRGPWRVKNDVVRSLDFNDVIDIFAKSKALMDALYPLGTRASYNTYLLSYLLTQLARAWAYEAGNISETVEDRAKVIFNGL